MSRPLDRFFGAGDHRASGKKKRKAKRLPVAASVGRLRVLLISIAVVFSLAGGRANILGTVVGALIMETLKKGLLMMGIAQEWQFVVTGIVVVIAVFVDNVRRKRASAV